MFFFLFLLRKFNSFAKPLQEDKLKSSFGANKGDLKTIKSAISCIRFLLINAGRFQTDETTFSTELQQLGLPVEHSGAISRVFSEQSENIQKHLIDTSFTGKNKNKFHFPLFDKLFVILFDSE